MYSLLKHNHSFILKTKCIVQGDNLSRLVIRNQCKLCRPVVSVGRTCVITHGSTLYAYAGAQVPLDIRILIGVGLPDHRHSRCDNGQSLSGWVFDGRRGLHVGAGRLGVEPLKPSSKVEETVTALKEKAKDPESKLVAKKSLKQRIVDELLHYYHGFKLLVIDINVSRKLLWRILQGKQLSRRESKLLIRTVGDMFRMVPFSVFIIVPFMEFLLPFFIKFFPGMLPSTFQTATEKEDKMKQALKVKLEMAKFLQKTLDEMAVMSKGHSSQAAKDFATFFEKIRTSGEMTTSEEIMKFSKLFEDEITLDSLPRPQLMALCRVLEMNPIGTTNFLRFQLRLKLRTLIADDMMIQKEGVDSLSQSELQAACRARGMRALGVSEERLKAQLTQWLDLSLVKKVPPSLLLLSQAFMLPETITTSEKLAATISALPDAVGTQTKAVIGEREGKVDNKTKIEVVKEELAKIKEERKEQLEEEKKEVALKEAKEKKEEMMVDQAPPLIDRAMMLEPALRAVVQDIKRTSITDRISHDELTTKDLEALEKALDALGKDQNKLLVEKEELQELRQEMAEYQEDIADLQKVTSMSGKEAEVKESRAAQLLFRRVNKMISKMDNVLGQLEQKAKSIKSKDELETPSQAEPSEEVLKIEDLISTINRLQEEPDNSRLQRISEVLSKMDGDRDGIVRVDSVLKVLEIIGNENVKLTKKQIDELIDLIDKEEAIELDDQIVKALSKKKEEATKAEKEKATKFVPIAEVVKKKETSAERATGPPKAEAERTRKGGEDEAEAKKEKKQVVEVSSGLPEEAKLTTGRSAVDGGEKGPGGCGGRSPGGAGENCGGGGTPQNPQQKASSGGLDQPAPPPPFPQASPITKELR